MTAVAEPLGDVRVNEGRLRSAMTVLASNDQSDELIAHAPWCIEHQHVIGCDGRSCYRNPQLTTFPATGERGSRDEHGERPFFEVEVCPERVLDQSSRHGGLAAWDTHVVRMNVQQQGWSQDHWFGFTVAQARDLRNGLSEAIALCEQDAQQLAQLLTGVALVPLDRELVTALEGLGVDDVDEVRLAMLDAAQRTLADMRERRAADR